jgi:death on curing protein
VIESALAAPRWEFAGLDPYPTLSAKAAVLAYALARSQACPDGNKRVALILLLEFLFMNGATLSHDDEVPADMILAAAESERVERERVVSDLTLWLAEVIVAI